MADNADDANDMRADLQKQIGELKSEMAKIAKSVGERAADFMDDAEDLYDEGRSSARRAAHSMRRQAFYVAKVARRNPGTTATVLTTVGLLGLAVGMVLGSTVCSGNRR